MKLFKIITKSYAVDKDGNKLDDPRDPLRDGVHYTYLDGTEAICWNKYIYNEDGTRESKAQKFVRLYGLSYDESLSWSQNVNKGKEQGLIGL